MRRDLLVASILLLISSTLSQLAVAQQPPVQPPTPPSDQIRCNVNVGLLGTYISTGNTFMAAAWGIRRAIVGIGLEAADYLNGGRRTQTGVNDTDNVFTAGYSIAIFVTAGNLPNGTPRPRVIHVGLDFRSGQAALQLARGRARVIARDAGCQHVTVVEGPPIAEII